MYENQAGTLVKDIFERMKKAGEWTAWGKDRNTQGSIDVKMIKISTGFWNYLAQ